MWRSWFWHLTCEGADDRLKVVDMEPILGKALARVTSVALGLHTASEVSSIVVEFQGLLVLGK